MGDTSDDKILERWCYLPRAFHEAMVKTNERTKAGADPNDPTLPVFQYAAMEAIEIERQRFTAGDKMALFGAIRKCANHDLVMPRWVADAFVRGYDEVLNCRVGSWDKAFGKPYPGKHLNALRKRRVNRFLVKQEIESALREGERTTGRRPAIDNELFEAVAQKLHINRDLVSKLYKSVRGPIWQTRVKQRI